MTICSRTPAVMCTLLALLATCSASVARSTPEVFLASSARLALSPSQENALQAEIRHEINRVQGEMGILPLSGSFFEKGVRRSLNFHVSPAGPEAVSPEAFELLRRWVILDARTAAMNPESP